MRSNITYFNFHLNKIILFGFFVLISTFSLAQNEIELPFPINNPLNPTQNTPQSFDLGDPTALKQSIVYNLETGTYIISETLGNDRYFRYPSMMTLEEYLKYEERKLMKQDWQEIIEEQTTENRAFELPIKIKNKIFKNIFGSDEIKIIPAGNLELSLGLSSSRVDNPMLPIQQRRITRFDFNQNINLEVTGQIGTKLKLSVKYNTGASFDFENTSKLEHTGTEDQILQKIALGNVSLTLPTTLIQGSQTLFGVKTQLKFGRATIDLIAASSKGKRTEINVAGKAQTQEINLTADNYDANKHYFLNLYHQQNYDAAMSTLPVVSSTTYITRIEVWVTNRTSVTENTRNILAFTDLGESKPENCQGNPSNFSTNIEPDNTVNSLYSWASEQPLIRGFSNSVQVLSSQVTSPGPFVPAVHYEKVENAKKLSETEFTYNALLGYISLNTNLNNDEVLAVAYEYTYRGETYQIGEFSTDGSNGQEALILKLLKPTITNPKNKIWDLMMKNVYSIQSAQVDQTGFRLDILYNNPETSVLVPFFPLDGVNDKQLVTLLEMDKINQNNQPFSDGVFDFSAFNQVGNKIENGGTINKKSGRIFFSTVEPFGKTLKSKLQNAGIAQTIIDKVVFSELYDSTKTAAQQIPSKNRFVFKGQCQSSISSDIPLNALNVPQGSVTVTAGGISLIEGTDYSVDYNLGRVKILNSGILESNTPIKVSIESNSVFGFQARTMIGGHFQYRFSEKFKIGGTWVTMMERPVTQKVDFGSEPFKNNIIGLDLALRLNAPFLTNLIDLLPIISTNQMSTVSFTGEFAHLIPGQPRVINKSGTSYIDDFEAAQSVIDLKSISSWALASIPQGQPTLFPEASIKNLSAGFKRSKIAWYMIDPVFYQSNSLTPEHIKQNPQILYDSRMRLVNQTDIFPNLQQQYGSIPNLSVLDLAYYPSERGMYNYDTTATVNPDGTFLNPENRWGGIMRSLSTNDFEQTNIEFIQFWVLDPFNEDAENVNPNSSHSGGELYFNLGNISEDILPDSRKSYENGLPALATSSTDNIDTTIWARISSQQAIVNAFDNVEEARINQDVGMDGWKSADEQTAYLNFVNWVQNNSNLTAETKGKITNDPSHDDYNYYLDDNFDGQQLDILKRYKSYNGPEGNSPTTEFSNNLNGAGYPTQATNRPDIEDINQDNNLSETENYFQYKVNLRPNEMQVGSNFITNIQIYQNGNKTEKWYQFKVPIVDYEKRVNGIQDFRSIRFMRMFLKNFDEEVVLRFAKLELIRGEWRRFRQDLTQAGLSIQTDPNLTTFNIGAVNVEENDQRYPIKYEVPPGISREVDPSQVSERQMNEQSLMLEVCNLQDGDARAAYRNVQFDVRTYKKLKMFVHAEEVIPNSLNNQDLTMFVRLGTDFVENYYEYEMPMDVTDWGANSPDAIWPEKNNMEIVFDDLLNLKKERNAKIEQGANGISYIVEYSATDPVNDKRKIKVKGSPNLQGIKTIMIGVRNPLKNDPNNIWKPDNGDAECAIVWVNELRLTDFVSEGGSAAIGQMQVQLADFGTIAASGNYSGINWGSVESRLQERQRNERIGIDINTTLQLGQFFGKQARLSLPFFYGYSWGVINPEYDPFNPDIKLKDYDVATRKERAKLGQDFSERRAFNFTNVRKEMKAGSKPHLWNVSNVSATYAFSEDLKRDFNTNYDNTKTWTGSLNYNYTFSSKGIEPFKKWKPVQKNKYLTIIKEFNLFMLPKNIAFSNEYSRIFNQRQIRNNLVPDYEFTPVYLKKFDLTRNYQIGYDLTKNIKTTFSATNKGIFEEGNHGIDRKSDPEGYREFIDTLKSQINTGGKTMDYTHNYSISYTIPLDKFPLTNWLSANTKYTGTFNWQRAPLGQNNFGNIIQNNRAINLTLQGNFINLYNKYSLLKKVLADGNATGRNNLNPKTPEDKNNSKAKENKVPDKIEEFKPDKPLDEMTSKELKQFKRKKRKWERKKEKEQRKKEKEEEEVPLLNGFLARLLMTVRNVSGTYAINDGTLLPGFNEETSVLGMNNRTSDLAGFIFGKQGSDIFGKANGYNIADIARDKNWLIQNENLNTQFTATHSANLILKSTLEPLKDLIINLNVTRNYSNNRSSFYRWNPNDSEFQNQSEFTTQNLTYSTITLNSAFVKLGTENSSDIFNQLLTSRKIVSNLIGRENSNSTLLPNGFNDGYSGSHQDVIIGAFLTAYSGNKISEKTVNPLNNIPLPNWTINYSGLTKFKFTKKILKSIKFSHSYSSTITVSGMQTNLNAIQDANGFSTARDLDNNFISSTQIQNVKISEKFGPLYGFLATWNILGKSLTTNFEFRKDRNTTLSLSNNQVTEVLGKEIVVGTVLTFPKLKLPFQAIKKSDLIININFSFRDNIIIIRKIIENTNQATQGQKVISFKLDANYKLSSHLNAIFYYEQQLNTPKVQTSFPTGNLKTGITIRYDLNGLK